jgi:hypothetical protein
MIPMRFYQRDMRPSSDQIAAIRGDTFASEFPRYINDPAPVLQTHRYAYPAGLIRCQANYCYLSEKTGRTGGGGGEANGRPYSGRAAAGSSCICMQFT